MPSPRIEPATIDDLPEITDMLYALFEEETDFVADRDNQRRGVRLILENPDRGRIFVLRGPNAIIGMINLQFTISTAEGAFVLLLEDLVVAPEHRGLGYGSMLMKHALEFAREKKFHRITLLAENPAHDSVRFFQRHGFRLSGMVTMRRGIRTED